MLTSLPALRVSVEPRGTWMVVMVTGDLDYANWRELAGQLEMVNGKQERPRLAVDLSGLAFCDSSGLRCLFMAWERARHRDGELLLLRPPARVRRIMEITGLADTPPAVTRLPE
jgi:anti-sigma B factor antagonist